MDLERCSNGESDLGVSEIENFQLDYCVTLSVCLDLMAVPFEWTFVRFLSLQFQSFWKEEPLKGGRQRRCLKLSNLWSVWGVQNFRISKNRIEALRIGSPVSSQAIAHTSESDFKRIISLKLLYSQSGRLADWEKFSNWKDYFHRKSLLKIFTKESLVKILQPRRFHRLAQLLKRLMRFDGALWQRGLCKKPSKES